MRLTVYKPFQRTRLRLSHYRGSMGAYVDLPCARTTWLFEAQEKMEQLFKV